MRIRAKVRLLVTSFVATAMALNLVFVAVPAHAATMTTSLFPQLRKAFLAGWYFILVSLYFSSKTGNT